MDFFNGLGRKFSNAARSVQNLTRESAENNRISADLRAARTELDRQLIALGRACYARARENGGEIHEELFRNVQEWTERIALLTARLESNRREIKCPSCGSMQAPDARFCAHCGRALPENAPDPEPEAWENVTYCPRCGAMRERNSRYCAFCGHAFFPSDAPEVPEAPAASPLQPPEEPEDAHRYDESL